MLQGGRNLVPATAQWTVGASAKQMKFTMSSVGLAFTASGASLVNIKYAILRNSTGALQEDYYVGVNFLVLILL